MPRHNFLDVKFITIKLGEKQQQQGLQFNLFIHFVSMRGFIRKCK